MCRCGSANSAIFAEIVPDNLRSVIYAFDRSFEGAVAACGMPLVGKSCPVMLCHLGLTLCSKYELSHTLLRGH